MTTYFKDAPKHCPMCGHKLDANNAIDGFDQGNICNCSSCQFEYIGEQPGQFTHTIVISSATLRCRIVDTYRSWPSEYRVYAEDGNFYDVYATDVHAIQ